eukprot:TRINITY_DN28452_c0_g2_i1.p1 TRINITY_DN28452_c0_g2~~TRINITY_DN28452_c0_g2_i1.p1  ORF type:complete len:407 (-),score=35.43 TRINITY_DN28452_c0_g2_i1:361-1443(-)
MQGWRLCQEDSHLALPEFDADRRLGLFAVFDGHCGSVVSQLAAEWLPEELRSADAFQSGNYPEALREAFLSVDRRLDSPEGRLQIMKVATTVRETLSQGFYVEGEMTEEHINEALDELCADNPDDMGCTAVVALIEYGNASAGRPSVLHVANCGDSRCVLWNAGGKAIAMSKDHKPTHKAERARVQAAGGWVSSEGRIEGNLNLSRALADFAYKRTRMSKPPDAQMISGVPEVRSRVLKSSDEFLLLGCDGVWETRRGSQATVDAARGFMPDSGRGKLSASLGRLLRDTLAEDESEGVGMDNMTSVLIELRSVKASRSTQRAKKKSARATHKKTQSITRSRQSARGVKRQVQKKPSASRR